MVVRGEPERSGALVESACVHGIQKLSSKNHLLMEDVRETGWAPSGECFKEQEKTKNKSKYENKNKNKGYVMGN